MAETASPRRKPSPAASKLRHSPEGERTPCSVMTDHSEGEMARFTPATIAALQFPLFMSWHARCSATRDEEQAVRTTMLFQAVSYQVTKVDSRSWLASPQSPDTSGLADLAPCLSSMAMPSHSLPICPTYTPTSAPVHRVSPAVSNASCTTSSSSLCRGSIISASCLLSEEKNPASRRRSVSSAKKCPCRLVTLCQASMSNLLLGMGVRVVRPLTRRSQYDAASWIPPGRRIPMPTIAMAGKDEG
ncbi:uncharacterized protein PpBr36_10067 [Pyricularia pennisetigena]|uniref:uncharacterized protein n=1 Tax=Pyricularia pennisetigena TaxID=1578925 RepID=UPI0011549892|nr:uncharacterized protein PpBr36_10067 [Pyricularia pennisetigena]TLS22502.1 hypothetical protein PpBr36_10067 [Pyricularia pennisetigena]